MTHLRLWRFDVPPTTEEQFLAAYGPDGSWARLFQTADGFIRTELWKSVDGSYLTADHWRSAGDFERFQSEQGADYRRLDRELEGIAGDESFIGAFETAC